MFKQFVAAYPTRTFNKGESILLKGDLPKTVYLIEQGMVKTYTISGSGEERLVLIYGKNEDFPIGYAFGLTDAAHYFYDAYTKCTLRLIPRDAYLKYLHANPEAMYKRHVRVIALLLTTLSRIDALEQSNAGDKVARTLLSMAEQLGVMLRPTSSHLRINVTQQEIADSLGITRETASIALKKLELKKLISYSRKNYTLYVNRLRRYLDDEE